MDFLQKARERYSVRKFEDRKVGNDKIDLILEAGRVAPTAANNQPQRILVLNNDESLENLKKCTPYHFNAPLAMIICFDRNISWKHPKTEKDMGEVDAAIVTTHMLLEISDLKLGSTWVAYFDTDVMRSMFGLPENIVPVAVLPIGYPSPDNSPHPMHYKRLEKSETIFYNMF